MSSSSIIELWELRKEDDALRCELIEKMHDTVGDREYDIDDEEEEEDGEEDDDPF